jgi:hypothetical protein
VEQDSVSPARYAEATPRPYSWRDRDATVSDGQEDTSPEAAFATGYSWAESNQIDDRRDCRRWRGSPAEAGCGAYLRDTDQHDPGYDQDRDVAIEPQ